MNIRNIYLIADVSFKELIRKGLFYLILFFSAGIILFSYYMNFFSLGPQTPIIKDFSLASISFFSVILTIVMAITIIPFELENKTIYPILAKPVRRYEYILGKFCGIIALVALNLLILSVLLMAILLFREGGINYGVLKQTSLVLVECMIVCSITLLLSLIVTPPVNFSVMFFIFLFGNLSNAYIGYLVGIMLSGPSGAMKSFVYGIAFIMQALKIILPSFSFFNIKDAVVHNYFISNFYAFSILFYGVLYTSFVLMMTYLVFEDKDL